MSRPAFLDHIDLRVRSIPASRKFYDPFMAALGLVVISDPADTEWVGYGYPGESAESSAPFFGLNPASEHRPNANRIAFAAATKEEVDRIGAAVRDAGARNLEGPEFCVEYFPSYYAVFFEDMDGNRFEVCCRTAENPGQGAD